MSCQLNKNRIRQEHKLSFCIPYSRKQPSLIICIRHTESEQLSRISMYCILPVVVQFIHLEDKSITLNSMKTAIQLTHVKLNLHTLLSRTTTHIM